MLWLAYFVVGQHVNIVARHIEQERAKLVLFHNSSKNKSKVASSACNLCASAARVRNSCNPHD